MAVTRVSQSSLKEGLEKSNNFLAGFAPMGMDYDSIATVTVGAGGASQIDFASIPQTYQHLHLRGLLRYTTGTTGEAMSFMRLNGISSTSYSGHLMYGDGTSPFGYGEASRTSMRAIECHANGLTASTYSAGYVDILDYRDTSKNTTIRSFSGFDANGSGFVLVASGALYNTAAVTSISILPNTPAGYSAFLQHSTIALYGLRAP